MSNIRVGTMPRRGRYKRKHTSTPSAQTSCASRRNVRWFDHHLRQNPPYLHPSVKMDRMGMIAGGVDELLKSCDHFEINKRLYGMIIIIILLYVYNYKLVILFVYNI